MVQSQDKEDHKVLKQEENLITGIKNKLLNYNSKKKYILYFFI